MSTIHQIYCQPRSAAAEPQGEPGSAGPKLGICGASLEGQELQDLCGQIAPCVYYALPRDTTDEQRGQMVSAAAPRRMFRLSLEGGLQVLGQVCFLGAPAAEGPSSGDGRPASFAHVLMEMEQEGQPRWPALDCLKLWGASAWQTAPGPTAPVAPQESLGQLLGPAEPALDDRVFHGFLTTPADGEFYDPAGVVPPRWRAMDPARRRDWFLDLFSLFLKAGSNRQGPVCVVAEPSIAALLFYGIARLVPEGPIRDGLSFSTYEPDPAQARVALAGTWFSSPETTAGQPDACPGCQLVVNTLQEPVQGAERPRTQYAVAMVRRAVEKSWDEVDWQLESVNSVKARKIEQLEMVAGADRLVVGLLLKGSFASQGWRKSPPLTMCVRKLLLRYLSRPGDLAGRLKAIVGGPAHLSVLDLLAPVKDLEARPAIELLLGGLPAEKFGPLLKLKSVSQADKLRALVRYVETQDTLPPGCDGLWELWAKGVKAGDPAKMGLLPHLFVNLKRESLAKFFKNIPASRVIQAVTGLVHLRVKKVLKSAYVTPVVEAMDEAALANLFRTEGSRFLEDYPSDEPGMGRQLGQMLRSLPQHPSEFKDRLDWVLAGQHLLESERDQKAVDAWSRCRNGIVAVGRLQEPDATVSDQTRLQRLVSAVREMAMAADEAMSYCPFDCENPHVRKQQCLRQIGQELLGKPLLPPGVVEHEYLWTKIAQQFETHQWPAEGAVSKETMRAEAAAKPVAGKKEPGKREPGKKEPGKKEGAPRETGQEPGKRLVGPEAKSLASTPAWLMYSMIALVVLITLGLVIWGVLFFAGGSGKKGSGRRGGSKAKAGDSRDAKEPDKPEPRKRGKRDSSFLPRDRGVRLASNIPVDSGCAQGRSPNPSWKAPSRGPILAAESGPSLRPMSIALLAPRPPPEDNA